MSDPLTPEQREALWSAYRLLLFNTAEHRVQEDQETTTNSDGGAEAHQGGGTNTADDGSLTGTASSADLTTPGPKTGIS